MLRIENTKEECKVWLGEVLIFSHSAKNTAFFVGFGKEYVLMYRGNFKIKDRTDEKIPLRHVEEKQGFLRFFYGEEELALSFKEECGGVAVYFSASKPYTRFWMRVASNPSEHIYGLGEQMSHFNLRGKLFPVWSSEPRVRRNKNTYVTWQSDISGMAGGDYWNTNYPQPSYLSSQKYYMLVDSYTYAEFDFRDENFHEVHHWEVPSRVAFLERQQLLLIDGKHLSPSRTSRNSTFLGKRRFYPRHSGRLGKNRKSPSRPPAAWGRY